jgi:hypothetical protein
MTNTTETKIIEAATQSWTRHRRHDGRPLYPEQIKLTLSYSASLGSSSGTWYAWCARYPERTRGRFAQGRGQTPDAAMESLLKELRHG